MSIVCGSDLGSVDVIAAAIAIAKVRGESELIIVHAQPESNPEALGQLQALIARAEEKAGDRGPVHIRTELLVGPAAEVVSSLADTEGASLIVVAAATAPSPLYRLGSTATKLTAEANVPVLLVKDAAPFVAWLRGERPLRAAIGVDESATCDSAIQLVKAWRESSAIDVVLGSVYYADEAAARFGLIAPNVVDAHPEVERLLARDLLRRFGESTGRGAINARPIRGLGRAGDHLVQLADGELVDLIVVGTQQTMGIGRLGSVSAVVAQEARQSVLCVPPTYQVQRTDVPQMRVAVVATDLSPFGNSALPYGYALIDPPGEVHIVHVVDKDERVDVAAVRAQLMGLAPTSARATTVAHVLVGNDAHELIAELAARVGADVICIASHGRSGISRALLGSVADRLLRHTRVPVLVLRPKAG
jgi:nucleotide-binding universal stress UspA family protein